MPATSCPTIVQPADCEANALRRRRGDVLQEEPDPGEQHDGQRQPVGDRQPDGVHAEVVAQLVGEHPGQLAAGQLGEGEGSDDHEMPAAREGVELLGRQHAQDVPLRWQPVGAGDVAPQRGDQIELLVGRPAGAEQRRQHDRLHWPDEQEDRPGQIADDEPPERDVPHEAHAEPDDEQGEQAERGDHEDGTDRRHRRRLDLAAATTLGHRSEITGGRQSAGGCRALAPAAPPR